MELNWKIYKAIQRGLNEALLNLSIDNFDDVETNMYDSDYEDINTHSGAEEYKKWKWVKDNFVDLGLPSGTLWCKWNIGATCEDTHESWYGNYYAWGETTTKNDYDIYTYSYHEDYEVLTSEQDIAYLTNNLMHMPSIKQIEELCSIPNKWVENYNGINGLNGRVFTRNNNELFIPAAGWFNSSTLKYNGYQCLLWTNSLYESRISTDYAWVLQIMSDSARPGYACHCFGLSVRGVIDSKL